MPRCVVAAREDRTFQDSAGPQGTKGPFSPLGKVCGACVGSFRVGKAREGILQERNKNWRRSVRTRRQKSVDFVVLFSEDVVQFSKTPVPPLAKTGAKNAGKLGLGPALQGAYGDVTGRSA